MPAGGIRRHHGIGLNPFRGHPVRRYSWAWAQLAGTPGPHLEVGIGDGAPFLRELARIRRGALVGADAHSGYLAEARTALPLVSLVQVEAAGRLPFQDASFGSVALLDVLEHVADESTTLSEAARVLRPGGLLVMSVPARHAFSWLDPDDVKYRAPRLHRWVMRRRYRGADYDARFLDDRDGLVGDIAAGRHRHENYVPHDLVGRVSGFGFRPRSRSGANLLGRPIDGVRLLVGGRTAALLGHIVRYDGRFRSANLFLAFERVEPSPLA